MGQLVRQNWTDWAGPPGIPPADERRNPMGRALMVVTVPWDDGDTLGELEEQMFDLLNQPLNLREPGDFGDVGVRAPGVEPVEPV